MRRGAVSLGTNAPFPVIIAIDGPAGSGKSTTARLVARRLGVRYLDTGATYRALALAAHRAGLDDLAFAEALPDVPLDVRYDGDGVQRVWIDGEDVTDALRAREMGPLASALARHTPVRERLVTLQRSVGQAIAGRDGGVVLDGRDIGTVVFPDADVKVFMVADPRERARRRQRELEGRGEIADLDVLEAEIVARDAQDAGRAFGPLRCASDAVVLDTTAMSPEEQVEFVARLVERIRSRA